MKVKVRQVPIRVPGFRFSGVRCGLKEDGKRDVALIASDVPAAAAAAFTTNRIKSAPVLVGMERAGAGRLQAVIVNSGNANAYTGQAGIALAREMCAIVGKELGIDERLVIPSSTGRIGVPMPAVLVRRGARAACQQLSADGFHDALEGMMTTDAFPKFVTERIDIAGRAVTVAGMTKGAGMIAPHMRLVPHATTLTYLLTDAAVSPAALRAVLQLALPQSFNAIVVDGDTSTSDTAVLLANGLAGNPPLTKGAAALPAFCELTSSVLRTLARMVVKDGEGCTKVIDIHVSGARNVRDAERVADTIARSPLCKTAFYGGDPYTGRIVCALGYSGARFNPERIDIYFDDVQVVRRGEEIVGKVERRAARVMAQAEFALKIDLHAGHVAAHRIASDLSVDYVRFNSDYRT